MKFNEETKEAIIPEEDFNKMMFCMLQLSALIKYGVKNWEHYQEAMESISKEEENF